MRLSIISKYSAGTSCVRKLATCVMALLLCVPAVAQDQAKAVQGSGGSGGWKTIPYQSVPIKLSIQVGKESILQFPWRVSMGSSSEMQGMVRNVPIGDAVYLTPLAPFENARFWAESKGDGSMMIIDISATQDAPPKMVRFVDDRASGQPPPAASTNASACQGAGCAGQSNTQREAKGGNQVAEHSYMSLARYAFQSLYSPERLIEPLDGVSEQPLKGGIAINDLVPGQRVTAKPAVEWRTSAGLFVTALLVRNAELHDVDLDPRRLRHSRDWLSSAFWSNQLSPSGSIGDETTMVVISRSAWRDSVNQDQ